MNEISTKPWIESLRQAPEKWRRRSGREKRLLCEAFILLGVARLAVLVLPFRLTALTLGRHMKEHNGLLEPNNMQTARMVGRAVRSAARHTPWQSSCLPQALTARWMTRCRHIPGTLYLGVIKEKNPSETMAAHAWLRCGQAILTGAGGHHQFTVVSTFS